MRHLLTACLVVFCCCGSTGIPSPRPLPPGVSFAGAWDSNWGQLSLVQDGVRVHGRYGGFRNGTVSGGVEGDVFRFRWTQEESQQHGHGYLQLSPDGQRMEGRWGYLRDATKGGRWWTRRVEN